jgi:hypothetical protein
MTYPRQMTFGKLAGGSGCRHHMWRLFFAVLFAFVLAGALASAQLTPSDDSYTLTSSPKDNFGAKNTMLVESSGATSFIRFDLSGIPPSVTGSMVAKGTLKIFVSTVPTAGSVNVDLVTSPWSEKTITANDSPTLGGAIASAIPIATADKEQYLLIDVTTAVVDWLNGTPNDGIALVPDGAVSFTFDSKETTKTSHPAELDIVLTGPAGPQGPPGPISGVTAGPGLTGGGTKGNVTVSMLTSCSKNQVLQWNGSTWTCSNAGTGTVTGVTAGTDLTGGGTSGNVTLNLDTTKIPQLTGANAFTNLQSVVANAGSGSAALGVTNIGTGGSYSIYSKSSGTYNIWANGGQYGIVAYGQTNPIVGQTVSGSPGVYGESDASGVAIGVQGVAQTQFGSGVFGVNGTESTSGVNFGGEAGVWGDAGSIGTAGMVATADNAAGIYVVNNAPDYPAIIAYNDNFSGLGGGIQGISNSSPNGAGVVGFSTVSQTAIKTFGTEPVGVSGDSGFAGGIGVWGTEDSGYAVYGLNNGPYVTGLFLNQSSKPSYALEAGTLSNNCLIDTSGDLTCTGNVSGAVQGQGERMVRLYAMQSPENWFEDFGSATLSDGWATVRFDPNFAATVNTSVEYHVFITPKGDSGALYVSNETASGFEVHEHGGGRSNIAFDYRIVGRRKGYENVRLEDVTDKHVALAALNQQMTKQNDPATRERIEKRMHPQFHAASRAGSIQTVQAARKAGHRLTSTTKH